MNGSTISWRRHNGAGAVKAQYTAQLDGAIAVISKEEGAPYVRVVLQQQNADRAPTRIFYGGACSVKSAKAMVQSIADHAAAQALAPASTAAFERVEL